VSRQAATRVLIVTHHDTQGDNFNGVSLAAKLRAGGMAATAIVWEKSSRRSLVMRLWPTPTKKWEARLIAALERRLSLHSILGYFPLGLAFRREFWRAEVVHLQLIQPSLFALWIVPILSALKPLVWTIHDPWLLTGHCIHPAECGRWKHGCGRCPDLRRLFEIRRDRTAANWRYKARILRRARAVYIVSSTWMHQMVTSSPFLRGRPLVRIPFGLDLDLYRPSTDTAALRRKMGLGDESFVVSFRSTPNPFKGTETVIQALLIAKMPPKTALLTFESKADLTPLHLSYAIRELGWVSSNAGRVAAYQRVLRADGRRGDGLRCACGLPPRHSP
jgi:glycosyltransferase involved in cell wall biosynthesis